ncbi:MAG: molybdenum cofactor biosynthesis protein MoaE, partial [Promethearchaeota archaeon]
DQVETLEIEAYDEMGKKLLLELVDKAKSQFEINNVYIIHRTGKLKVGDKIVCIAISAAHRKDAFKACEWLINELKKIVPIWKKEIII